MKYYDFHGHLGKTSSGEENTATMLVEDLKKYGIEKVGISNLTLPSMEERNDLIYDAMCQYPDFIKGYMYINFRSPRIYEEIDYRLNKQGFSGCKIVTSREGIRGDNYPRIKEIMPFVAKYGKVVQVFAGTSPYCTPFVWADLAEKNPDLILCFTHIACRELGYTLIELIRDIPNTCVETSQNFEVDMLKKAIDVLGSERVLMGTDWPYKPTKTELYKFEYMGIPEDKLENIYWKNAARLWGEL